MREIKYPAKRTFWKATGTGVLHQGFTDPNQVTTTGQPTLVSNTDATTIYTVLPASGTLIAGEIYSYNKGMVQVVQTHERTIYAPEQTPTLFNVYRANTDDMAWVANENVVIGDTRIYLTIRYKCIQSHVTREKQTPDITPALWVVVATSSEWTVGVAYKVNDIVTYLGKSYMCLQSHTSQAGWNPVAVPALWKLQ